MQIHNGFILTRHWYDTPSGIELVFWVKTAAKPIRVVISGQEAVCFIRQQDSIPAVQSLRRQPLGLKTLDFDAVDGLYFRHQRDLNRLRQQVEFNKRLLLESDIKPDNRYLMERFITASMAIVGDEKPKQGYIEIRQPRVKPTQFSPEFSWVSLDIETSDLKGQLYSIAVTSPEQKQVFITRSNKPSLEIGSSNAELSHLEALSSTGTDALKGDSDSNDHSFNIQWCENESDTLRRFFTWLQAFDPDLILGWNVVGFDLSFLQWKCKQLGVPFNIGRGKEKAIILDPQTQGQIALARIPGRIVLDGIAMLRSAFWIFERYDLGYVAQQLLGEDKLIEADADKLQEIRRLYAEDPIALAKYNLQDCELVARIFEKTDLINFAIQRSEMTGLAMGREGGSVAAYDYLYLPRLHRQGFVAPDVGSDANPQNSPGGYVMDSRPGLYRQVLVLDFKSLYPSIIRTFKIDPLGLALGLKAAQCDQLGETIPGFLDAHFSRSQHILPDTITELWKKRDEAKADNNAAMSQAIKIIMNSFYGVLGSYGCRFFNPQLASSITKRGHEIIQRSRDVIEQQGYEVIYGDTDSVFVWLGEQQKTEAEAISIGNDLAEHLNDWWTAHLRDEYSIPSHLEIEFETYYQDFFMPTIRGAEKGSKKRYAGRIRNKAGDWEIKFKGLESVRTDWTELSKQFQRELYQRIFDHQPYKDYICEVVDQLWAGEWDEHLVYCKRLRRPLNSYTRAQPPHVKAARKLDKVGRRVCYVITLQGQEPVELFNADSTMKPDYQHYVDKQLEPVADSILQFMGTSFEQITQRQLDMF